MFVYLLAALLIAAAVHAARAADRSLRRTGEIFLLYVLLGYCGLPMLFVSGASLLSPDRTAELLGFPAGNPFQAFLGFAYLGLSVISVLALRYRGTYLIAPAICWAVFFAGATAVHLRDHGARAAVSHHDIALIFVTHGLISLILVAALASSGLLERRA